MPRFHPIFVHLLVAVYSFQTPSTILRSHKVIGNSGHNTAHINSVAMNAETKTAAEFAAGKKRPLHSIYTMIADRDSSSLSTTHKEARLGDILTVEIELSPENDYVPDQLFDPMGEVTFVLGWGNFLPGLHELLMSGISNDYEVSNVSIDAGFGRHNPDLVIEVPKKNLKKVRDEEEIVPKATLNLEGGIKVTVLDVTKDTVLLDANHPLSGSSYSCNLKVLSIDPYPLDKLEFKIDTDTSKSQNDHIQSSSQFEIATFAMGCFWGVELAFMRTPGVVGTRAGYTQGIENPSYEEIKKGGTGHREAVMVIYDSRVVSYKELLTVYSKRLAATATEYIKLDMFAEDNEDNEKPIESPDSQYKHGLYYHNEEQKKLAQEYINSMKDSRYSDIELKPATLFYNAEEKHQQYLYKGGQSARKGCRETIRCYG